MKARMLTLTAVGAAVVALLAGPAVGGNRGGDVCRNGGFRSWTDTPNGLAFKNLGQCLQAVNDGKELFPAGEL
jgi:hypothetical protein